MCLISVAPKGTIKQCKQIEGFIRKGMSSNTDGSGFMYKRNGADVINLDKGYETPEAMINAINDLKLGVDDELVIHHRIGTSGEKNVLNMHPFLVSDSAVVLQATKGEFNFPGMAHNGVFSGFTDRQSAFNDTYHFVRDFISTPELLALLKRDAAKFSEMFKSFMNYPRLAFLFPDRDLILIGNFTEDEGYFHSNGGYKEYTYDKGGSSNYWPAKTNKQNSRIGRQLNLQDTDNDYYLGYPSKQAMDDAYEKEEDDYYSSEAFTENKGFLNETPKQRLDKAATPHIKFNSKDISITEYNFMDFFLSPTMDYSLAIKKDKLYTIEDFDPKMELNYVKEVGGSNVMYSMNHDRLFNLCECYVKSSFRANYEGLNKLIKTTNRNISASMAKKISKALTKKTNKQEFNFKEYGKISWHDLYNFYQSYKPVKSDATVLSAPKSEFIRSLDEFIANKEPVTTNVEIVVEPE